MNPFFEEAIPLTPGIPLPLFIQKETVMTSPEASRMPPSPEFPTQEMPRFSPSPALLPDVQSFAPSQARLEQTYGSPLPPKARAEEREANFGASPQPQRQDYRSLGSPQSGVKQNDARFEAEDTNRGRTPRRPPSPTHIPHVPSADTTNPQKRSRSPLKKFLGFGKSTSLKNIPSGPQSKTSSASPEKNTTPLTTWGNRIRHGFLVPPFLIQALWCTVTERSRRPIQSPRYLAMRTRHHLGE